jgi:hypothetical protein
MRISQILDEKHDQKGANPTIESYNASAVKNYDAANSIARFQINFFIFFMKNRSSLLLVVVVLAL